MAPTVRRLLTRPAMPRSFLGQLAGRRLLRAVALAGVLLPAAASRAEAQLVCAGGPTADPCVVSTKQDFTNAGTATFDLGGRALVIGTYGRIKVTPGSMSIVARSVEVKGGGALVATGASGAAGTIALTTTGDVRVDAGATVNASALSAGGQIAVYAAGALQVDGTITAEATGAGGTGGFVALASGGPATVSAAGLVVSAGGANGGRVLVVSGQDLHLGGGTTARIDVAGTEAGAVDLATTGTGSILIDGIVRALATQASGDGGCVTIDSANAVTLSPTALVRAQGGQLGGLVAVTAAGPIQLSSGGGNVATVDVSGRAQAGTVILTSGAGVTLAGAVKAVAATSDAFGGSIAVEAGSDVSVSGAAPLSVTGGNGTGIGGDVSVVAHRSIVVSGPVAASGADGGQIALMADGALATTSAGLLDVGAAGTSGSAGVVALLAQGGDVVVAGPVRGTGAGQGGELDVTAHGNARIDAPVDLSGALSDGSGGVVDLHAGGSFTQTAAIVARGVGAGCGSASRVSADGTLTLGAIDVSAPGCGGTLDVTGLAGVTATGEINADGTNGFAGVVNVAAAGLQVTGNLHASGPTGGQITLHACDLSLAAGSRVTATGAGGRNVLQANASMTIGGAVLAASNSLQYASQPPVLLGTGSVLPGTVPLRVALTPCVPPPPTTSTTSTTSTSTTSTSSTSRTSTTTPTTSSTTSTAPATTPTTVGTTTTSTTTPTGGDPSTTSTTTPGGEPSTTSTTTPAAADPTTTLGAASSSTTSTTSSTLPAPPPSACEGGDASACDDGDPCTEDVCADGACLNLPPAGMEAVVCPLGAALNAIRSAAPDAVGGEVIQGRLVRKVVGMQKAVGAPGVPPRTLKRALRQLNGFIHAVERGMERGVLQPDPGHRVLAEARQALANLVPLVPRS